jgi:hypothetical protein
MAAATFTAADVDYIRRNYLTLAQVCAGRAETADAVRVLIEQGLLPRPSYVLADGTEMVPADYFRLVDEAGGSDNLQSHFAERHRAAGGNPEELAEDWEGYMDGIYGVCLEEVVPETMVRKTQLVESIGELLDHPQPDEARWRRELRRQVDELDALERQFAPDYDRSGRFEQLPTRDRLIGDSRRRYPEVFAEEIAQPFPTRRGQHDRAAGAGPLEPT